MGEEIEGLATALLTGSVDNLAYHGLQIGFKAARFTFNALLGNKGKSGRDNLSPGRIP